MRRVSQRVASDLLGKKTLYAIWLTSAKQVKTLQWPARAVPVTSTYERSTLKLGRHRFHPCGLHRVVAVTFVNVRVWIESRVKTRMASQFVSWERCDYLSGHG
jgi:hypothetical protein